MFTVCGAGYAQKVNGDPINPVSVDLQYAKQKVLIVQYFNFITLLDLLNVQN